MKEAITALPEKECTFRLVHDNVPSPITGTVKKVVGVNEIHLLNTDDTTRGYSLRDLKNLALKINVPQSPIKVHVFNTIPIKATIAAKDDKDVMEFIHKKLRHVIQIE
ncbi:MAG: hypothetical protein COX77_04435 [Candidatus Komeilibacteria bacterium CG_4_10_14_0_2_um_filter_37_10]|uniref:Uncharacterized protein n=1 Tax=Candidatus Komeilibacteria bacterium CG_4_10_14_0_2_um_filter_37_10 TaxID=1974470 RepID=A0A2M7VDL3_9BACT|nr:MAG: hypothetical protein COX77_04435 [Candidatus Komeilibacteria bacterium CG_4_10_14_0_2_um_filter_37_10]